MWTPQKGCLISISVSKTTHLSGHPLNLSASNVRMSSFLLWKRILVFIYSFLCSFGIYRQKQDALSFCLPLQNFPVWQNYMLHWESPIPPSKDSPMPPSKDSPIPPSKDSLIPPSKDSPIPPSKGSLIPPSKDDYWTEEKNTVREVCSSGLICENDFPYNRWFLVKL